MATLLPEEIWCRIFAYLDPFTIHEAVSVVCKDFLRIVRQDKRLSGSLKLSRRFLQRYFNHFDIWSKLETNKFHLGLSEFLKKWPKVTEIEIHWLPNQDQESLLLQFTLQTFKELWNTSYLKSVVVHGVWINKGPFRLDGLTYNEEVENVQFQSLRFYPNHDTNIQEDLKWLIRNVTKVFNIEIDNLFLKQLEKDTTCKVLMGNFLSNQAPDLKSLLVTNVPSFDCENRSEVKTNFNELKIYFCQTLK